MKRVRVPHGLHDRFGSGFGRLPFRRVRTSVAPGSQAQPYLAVLQPIYSLSAASTAAVILSAASVGGLNYANTGGAVSVRGFAGGVPGQIFLFYNQGAHTVTLLHLDGTVPELSARIACPGAADLALAPGALGLLLWNDALGYWLVLSAP